MKSKILVVLLAMSLVCAWSGSAAAGILGYSLDKSDRAFKDPPAAEPSATVVVADGLIARPLAGATTIGGTALFLLTLPFSIPSGSTREAAQGMIVRPGGYTFVRPMGRSDPRFEEKGVFGNK